MVKDPKTYEGKIVQISGMCKSESGIMNRNWIHIKDGTKDDFDLVITSESLCSGRNRSNYESYCVLNKDFGAGYQYDLILENGTIVK